MKNCCAALLFVFLCSSVFAQGDGYVHPDWAKDACIYEVNIRQYTNEGTFKAFEKELPRLKKLGVQVLWLMPIFPIGEKDRKGTLGSYYAVKDYRAVNPEFGTMDDLKGFVKKAHGMGFKVILDWVANHSAPDNELTTQHPDWYTHDSTGKIIPPVADWTDVADFNYDNKELWKYQTESMKFWLKEADVDGFRCDVAMMVPMDFWKQNRKELDKVKKVFMLAEAEGADFHRNGFDMTYGWELMNLMNEIAKGKKKASDIEKYQAHADSTYKKNDYHMNFTTNHDENSWNGTEFERLGPAAKSFAALTFVLPGMPLIYTGQEAGLAKRLRFFDKDTIEWKGFLMQDFYSKLIALKTENPVLGAGVAGAKIQFIPTGNPNVIALTRKKEGNQVIAIFNFSSESQACKLKIKRQDGKCAEIFTGKTLKGDEVTISNLEPYDFFVYEVKN